MNIMGRMASPPSGPWCFWCALTVSGARDRLPAVVHQLDESGAKMRRVCAAIVIVLVSVGLARARQGAPQPATAGPKLAAPTAFPSPGTYGVGIAVTLQSADPDAELRYTLDGSAPTTNSARYDPAKLIFLGAVYDGDRGVRTAYTVRAVTVKAGAATSDPATFVYTIDHRDRTTYVSEPVLPGVRMIRDSDNDKMFLVTGSLRAALIDSGQGRGALRQYLAPYLAGRPLTVIFTHNHGDHIGQADQFVQDSTEYIGEADRPALVQRLKNAGVSDATIDAQVKAAPDGLRVDLGGRALTVYLTPGHTPGSLVVFDEPNGVLFTGDSFGSNNPIVPDSAYMHLAGSLPMDAYMAAIRATRARVRGKVVAVLTGHNDRPLFGERYLDSAQIAVQRILDGGAEVLVPAPRPANGWWSIVGDRLTDPDWVAISVNRDRMLPTPPAQLASLSELDVAGAPLEPAFAPATLLYRVHLPKGTTTARVEAIPMSSRATVTVNGGHAVSNADVTVPLKGASTRISLVVTAPDGHTSSTYQVTVTRP
jgi:glyoxylase-like metal-dependent hydrolase (beta-lactamase superfamily II)